MSLPRDRLRSRSSLVSPPITCWSVTHSVLTPRGIKYPQHKKTVGAFRPLERGERDWVRRDEAAIFSQVKSGHSGLLPGIKLHPHHSQNPAIGRQTHLHDLPIVGKGIKYQSRLH